MIRILEVIKVSLTFQKAKSISGTKDETRLFGKQVVWLLCQHRTVWNGWSIVGLFIVLDTSYGITSYDV